MLKRASSLALVLILCAVAIRSAAVSAWSERRPELARALWASHPRVITNQAMSAIGFASGRGEAPPDDVLDYARAVARQDPLAPEPLTIAGTSALARGDYVKADGLLTEALRRDPRKLAPHYLLADLSLRSGDLRRGLSHVSALTKQMGQTLGPVIPALVAFSAQPGSAEAMAPLFNRDPILGAAVLEAMAKERRNADFIIGLWQRTPALQIGNQTRWQTSLVQTLLAAGQFARAKQVWERFVGVSDQSLIFNPTFKPVAAPAPFNWTLTSGSAGLAEAVPGGVRFIYYGREDVVLASQTLLLTKGTYALRWKTKGEADNLIVRVACLPKLVQVATVALEKGSTVFTVPPQDCQAQQLEFRGNLGDVPTTVQPSLTALQLGRTG